jgi:hypothetical protein
MSAVLPDLERGFTWTEEYRHQCEVRTVIRWRRDDRSRALNYLEDVRKKRGKEAGDRLENDVRDQWAKGNRGQEGDWK